MRSNHWTVIARRRILRYMAIINPKYWKPPIARMDMREIAMDQVRTEQNGLELAEHLTGISYSTYFRRRKSDWKKEGKIRTIAIDSIIRPIEGEKADTTKYIKHIKLRSSGELLSQILGEETCNLGATYCSWNDFEQINEYYRPSWFFMAIFPNDFWWDSEHLSSDPGLGKRWLRTMRALRFGMLWLRCKMEQQGSLMICYQVDFPPDFKRFNRFEIRMANPF